jgi:pSer/pThr/pTyr-binding forkhead associated (FHA) protein
MHDLAAKVLIEGTHPCPKENSKMFPNVTLTVTEGDLIGTEYFFDDTSLCVVGRSRDCSMMLPEWHNLVSRHHCLFDIDGPEITVRDLGSMNGTFVNGELIGKRDEKSLKENTLAASSPRRPLHDGDTVKVGDVVLQVNIDSEVGELIPMEIDVERVTDHEAAGCPEVDLCLNI